MAVTLCAGALTRRRFLTTAASSGALVAVGGIAKPALSRAADRPVITHGIQSGDVSVDSGVVWARADRPARMLVEVATSDSFKSIRSEVFVDALPETDFTAKALIEGLPAGQDIFYRVRLQDHSFPTVLSAPQVGHFRTAPSERRTVSFVWSGDTAGGGWGIDEAHLLDHIAMPARLFHSFRRSHLRRLSDRRGEEASERRDVEERRHR